MSRTVQCMKDDDGGLRVVLGLLAGLALEGLTGSTILFSLFLCELLQVSGRQQSKLFPPFPSTVVGFCLPLHSPSLVCLFPTPHPSIRSVSPRLHPTSRLLSLSLSVPLPSLYPPLITKIKFTLGENSLLIFVVFYFLLWLLSCNVFINTKR